MTMKTLNRTWIARCKRCKTHLRVESGSTVKMWNNKPAIGCECGAGTMSAALLKSILTEHECGSKCMSAKGHVCECSCGGTNHGKAA